MIATCLIHLNIVEIYTYFNHSPKLYLTKDVNDSSKQEEDTSQKEIKEKSEVQGKYCARNYFFCQRLFILLDNKEFIIINTLLNIHPYTDSIIQPPDVV